MQICYNNAVSLGLYNISNMPRQARKTSGTGIYHHHKRSLQTRCRIQAIGKNNRNKFWHYTKSSNRSENRPLI
jgi:hypothetical protein